MNSYSCSGSSCWENSSPKNSNERQSYFMDCAAKIAQKSVMEHKHGSVIVMDNNIIGTGFNYLYEHMCHKKSIHAEVDALLNVKGRRRNMLGDAEMYVVRIGKKSMDCPLKYSRPCNDCQKAIMKYGIRKVYYSTSYEYNQAMERLVLS
jgi:deoxycytidylate deaminase